MCRQVEISSDERDTRHHYLKGLEGCSTGLLAGVQTAFESLYGLLRTLLDHSLRTVQVTDLNDQPCVLINAQYVLPILSVRRCAGHADDASVSVAQFHMLDLYWTPFVPCDRVDVT